MPIAALGMWLLVSAADAEERPPLKPELQQAGKEYLGYLGWLFQEAARSGIGLPFDSLRAAEVKKRCAAVIKEAPNEPQVRDAAQLLLDAYQYATENFAKPKEGRKKPSSRALADLLADNKDGLTEGCMMRAIVLAELRFGKTMGFPVMDEKAVRAMDLPDADLSVLRELPADSKKATDFDEITLKLDAKGIVQIQGKVVAKEKIIRTLQDLKFDAEKRHRKISVLIKTGEQTRYGDITGVLDQLAKAQIENVTFSVGLEEE